MARRLRFMMGEAPGGPSSWRNCLFHSNSELHDEHISFRDLRASTQNKSASEAITLAPPTYSVSSSPNASSAKPPQNSISWTKNQAASLALLIWRVTPPQLGHFHFRRSKLIMANAPLERRLALERSGRVSRPPQSDCWACSSKRSRQLTNPKLCSWIMRFD